MARIPASGQNALKTINNILNTILSSRLQRKAKSVIISSVETIFVALAIYAKYQQLEIENDFVANALRVSIFFGVGYAAFLAIFLFVHSYFLLKDSDAATNERVEKAYAKTNKIPVVDGVFELAFPIMFRGPFWFIPYVAWVICGAVIGLNAYFFYTLREEINMESRATLGAGALLLYQITSDFSEYWVHSRNHDDESSGTNSNAIAAGSVNDGDVEASGFVGERETASSGFTRI